MYVSVFAIYLILSSFISHSQAAGICDANNFRQIQSGDGTFASLNNLFSQIGNQTNLHVFGEVHFYTNRNLLAGIIQQITPSLVGKNKCLFLEVSKGGLAFFEQKIKEKQSEVKTSADQDKLDMLARYYPSLVEAAETQKMKVFEIDHPDHITEKKTESERNHAMAKNALELLSNGQCDSALLFVGKAHISPPEFETKSLITNLREIGLKPITYNVVDVSDPAPSPLWSWSKLCAFPDDIPAAFSNSLLLPNTVVFPLYSSERKMIWNDFDFSILRSNFSRK